MKSHRMVTAATQAAPTPLPAAAAPTSAWVRVLTGCCGPHTTPSDRRAFRVTLLLFACVLMSFLDLELTLLFARTVGMFEVNPIARAVMQTNSPMAVIGFKVSTVVFACTVLYWRRRTRMSEAATWVCFAALLSLSIRWLDYGMNISEATPVVSQLAGSEDAGWVRIGE